MSKRRKRRKVKVTEADRAARRAQALISGAEIKYLICPLCHKSHPLKTDDSRTLFRVNGNYAIISTRVGGGDRVGFFRIPEKDITLKDLKESYPLVFNNLRNSVEQLSDLIAAQEKKNEE